MREPYNPDLDQSEIGGTISTRRGIPAPGDDYMDRMEATGRAMRGQRPMNMTPSQLDSTKAVQLYDRLMGWYVHELDRQNQNRLEMAMDEDFYDHIQWTDEEVQVLQNRGQAPLVFNVTQTTVNWVLGSQRRMPKDFKILPRKKEGGGAAQRKTELLKHLSDENRSEFEWAEAFAMSVKAGLGWMECGQGRPEEGVKVYDRHEDWRCMLWDSTSRRYDLLDARYLFRTKWLDTDIAASLWSKRRGTIQAATSKTLAGFYDGDDKGDEAMDSLETAYWQNGMSGARSTHFGIERDRVRVIEAWFKMVDDKAVFLKGGQFSGEMFDEWSPGHWRDVKNGYATLSVRPAEVIHVALMTDAGLLDLRRSPYRHNRYPFTPLWGYRRRRDGMPYGLIRGIRDIQRDLNKRGSKALHHMSSTRTMVASGSVEDIETLRDEVARPDGIIEYDAAGGKPAPVVQTDLAVASAHLDLMSRDAELIQQVGGVTDENLGRRTNATSGIAIERRQNQGSLATSMFFENLRMSRSIHGEKLVVLIETFYDKRDEFRITDMRGNPDFKVINDGDPANAISEFKADFIISEEDWRATQRQAQAEALLGLTEKLAATAPQLVVGVLDLVVEALDVPKRDELVKRIRNLTGQDDPDADPDNPDPETLARKAAAEKQNQFQERLAMADLSEKEAKARKTDAEANKIKISTTGDVVAQLKASIEAAVAIAGASAVAAAADQVLATARQEAMGQTSQPQNPGAAMPVASQQIRA